LRWHDAGKMKKVFVVIMSFALGLLVLITRYLQKRGGSLYDVHAKENWITIILLLLTWGTPFFILYTQGSNKKKG